MKKIAIIGKPNVGKSSFYNRIVKKRDAVTSDISGTTRDVKKSIVDILGKEAELLDTGGLDASSDLFVKVQAKSILTAKKADIIIYMVDGRTLPSEDDKKFFYELQKLNKAIALVINKIDNDKLEENIYSFYEFGVEPIFTISLAHNRKVNKVLEWISGYIDDNNKVTQDSETSIDDFVNENYDDDIKLIDNSEIKIAIIGKVNVGKSSLLNALLKDERSIVSDIPGTTIDPVDDVIEQNGREFRFVDTAGIRKRGQIKDLEKYALNRTEEMLKKAEVALIVIDASKPFSELDEKIAGLVDKYNLASIIVLNKWDQRELEFKEATNLIRDKFKFLYYSPIITVSALTLQRVYKIYDMIIDVYNSYTKRISTSKLNNTIKEATLKHPLPSPNGKSLKIYYATQYNTKPPSISLSMNRPNKLHFTYKRYLINRIRDEFGFVGSPIFIKAVSRSSEELDK